MYLSRPAQAQYLFEKYNLPIKRQRLDDLASRGSGPREVVINGRCLSTREWLDAWIADQAAQPVRRRCRSSQSDQAA